MTTNPKFYRFSYYIPKKKNRTLLPHQLRDADAFVELSTVLISKGYEYGGLILNYPAQRRAPTREVDMSFLTPDDLIVVTTRPPLDDEIGENRKWVSRSHTTLENKVFDTLRPYLKTCTRLLLELSPELAEKLPTEFVNRASVAFKEKHGAPYLGCKPYGAIKMKRPPTPARTALYLLYPPKLNNNDPQIFCTFGMGGTESLIWAYFLHTRFRDKLTLDAPRFIMAEMITEQIPDIPNNLSFANQWKVDFLLDVPLYPAVTG